MRRVITLFITFTMIISLFPLTALAEDKSTEAIELSAAQETTAPEPTATPIETPTETPTATPIATPTPEATIKPESIVTEAMASSSPTIEPLFLYLSDSDNTSDDGVAYYTTDCSEGEAIELEPSVQSNGTLNYIWQVYNEIDDDYINLNLSEVPTAHDEKLALIVESQMLNIKDLYRCIVVADLNETTLVQYGYFTLKGDETKLTSSSDENTFDELTIANTASQFAYTLSGGVITITGYTMSEEEEENGIELVIPSSIAGYPVNHIGNSAFGNNSHLLSVVLPNTLRSIGNAAFSNCSLLSSVTFQSNITSIGSYAFSGCSYLSSIDLPVGLTTLAEGTFSDCTSLTDIVLPSGLTTLGAAAFYNCTMLLSVTIPASLTIAEHGTNANLTGYLGGPFQGCSALDQVIFNGTRTTIPGYLFARCTGPLSRVDMDGISVIDERAFAQCVNLQGFPIPAGLTTIGASAFLGCGVPTTLSLPNSLINIGTDSFSGCKGLKSIVFSNGLSMIPAAAFSGCTSLNSVVLPNNLITLGAAAFYNCTMLLSVTIPASLTTAEHGTNANSTGYLGGPFQGCSSLDQVIFTGTRTTISAYLFARCAGPLSRVDMDGITTIEGNAFRGCSNLATLPIPSGLITIGKSAFYECTVASSVQLPASLRTIGDYAFYGCQGLKSISLQDGVTSIGTNGFFGCIGLTSVRLPDTVISLGDGLFGACSALQSVVLPARLQDIPTSTFEGCKNLSAINLPRFITSIKANAFKSCSGLLTITIPAMTKIIATTAFTSGSSQMKIYGVSNSYAQTFAAARGFTFVAVDNGGSIELRFDDSQVTLTSLGISMPLQISTDPINSLDEILFSSSDQNVVTVSTNGIITSCGFGTAIIYAMTAGGAQASCIVRVPHLVTSINIQGAHSVEVGASTRLTATVNPETATDRTVTWSSSNTSIAIVSELGEVAGVSPGSASIRATANDGSDLYAEYSLTVSPIRVKSITVTGAVSVEKGQSAQYYVSELLPINVADGTYTWSIANGTGSATINTAGRMTAVSVGSVTVFATANDESGTYGSFSVTITPIKVSAIRIAGPDRLSKLSSIQLTIDEVLPNNADDKTITWSIVIGGTGEATIDPVTGTLRGVKAGTVNIRASANDNSGTYSEKTIVIEPLKVSSFTILGFKWAAIGQSTLLSISNVLPSAADDQNVTWSIESGVENASIESATGILTGIAEGIVTVRATANDGSGAFQEINISIVKYTAVIYEAGTELCAGKTLQLTGGFLPENLTNTTIRWSLAVGDLAYASISSTGLLIAKPVSEQHTITVIASPMDGKANTAEKKIIIYPLVSTLMIVLGETDVTGCTLLLNSNTNDVLTLNSICFPTDAKDGVTWTLSSTSAATMDVSEEGVATITPVAGKSQLVTLTAKANDGSGKIAIAKIQVTALSAGITVSDSMGGTINGGGKTQLAATFTDPQPTNKAIKWYLAPEYDAYATISATGLLTARPVTQEATIIVQAIPIDGGTPSDPYSITIKPLVTAVTIQNGDNQVTNSTLMIDLRGTTELQLSAKTWPESTSGEVTWRSSAPLVALVDADTGLVTGLTPGSTTISAVAKDGSNRSASVKVNVGSLPQSIALVDSPTVPLTKLRGGTGTMYRVKDTTAGGTDAVLQASAIRWTMDSKYLPYAVISSSGILTTYPVSKATTIKVGAEVIGNEETANLSFDVTIYPATQSVSLYQGMTLQTKPIMIDSFEKAETDVEADSVTLTAQKLPSDSMEGITWTSSNMNVAQVVDGVVKPVWNGSAYNKGTAIITAKASDGTNVSASVKFVVAELAQGITLAPSNTKLIPPYELRSGSTMQLKATIVNPTATNKAVVYSIVDGSDYATLSASGLLTAKQVYGDRTLTVQATSVDGGAAASLEITVQPKYDEPLTIVRLDKGETISGESVAEDVTGVSAKSTLFNLSIPEAVSTTKVKWSVAPSYVASVVTSGSDFFLKYLATGTAVVTATATDVGGVVRTASFTIELYKPATSLTITPPKGVEEEGLTLASGKTMLLTGVIAPTTGVTTKGVNWSLDESYADYATISSAGLLTAKAGLTEQVTIQVYAETKNAPYCDDTIEILLTPLSTGVDILSDESVVNSQTLTIDLTTPTLDLDAVVYEDGKANPNVVWTSSNKTLATVDADGVVKGLKAGTVTVTAKAADGSGKFATMKVVIQTYVTGLEITSKNGFDMCGGKTLQLGVTFTPTTPTDKRITWSLSTADSQYATISAGGLLKAKALTSKVSITVVATSVQNEGAVTKQVINIYPATTKVEILNSESVVLNGTTLVFDLNTMTSKTLGSLNQPSASTGALQGVTWKSSNTAVLTISADGEIAPVLNAKTGLYNTGTVTITATAKDGSGKSATVKIVAGYLVSAIGFDSGLTVAAGKTLTLKPTFDPVNVTNKKLTWSMKASDAPYATISSTGILTAKKVTEAKDVTVYCTAQDGSGVVKEIPVTIIP